MSNKSKQTKQVKQSRINREITKLFKKWIVRRDNGNCQILFALTELDDFIDEIEILHKQAQQEAVERGKLEAYKEVMAFRSPYLYDDYSSLYQHSKELQKEYYEEMGKFLKKKIGLYENE